MKEISAIQEPIQAKHLTKYYEMVHTQSVISRLEKDGFYLSDSGQRRTRNPENRHSTFHFARMRHESIRERNGTHPEILITNSHDGNCSLRFYVGLFRYVCSNGLIVGEKLPPIVIRHRVNAENEAMDAAKVAIHNAMETARRIDVFRARILSPIEQNQLVDRVSKELYEGRMGRAILEPRRSEDAQDDLWSVFNRIQENALNGGVRGVMVNGRPFTTRRVRGARAVVDVNRKIWDLAEAFL